MTAFLGVPFLRNGKVIGMVAVANRKDGFRPEDQMILEALTPPIVELLIHKRTEEALRVSEERYKALVEELHLADHRKNEFLGVLSHELRNPLASIMMGLSLLEQASPGGIEEVQARDTMTRQAQHLTHLVDDLLDLTRITRGKISLQREFADLNDVLGQTLEDFRIKFKEKGVVLEAELSPFQLAIEADVVRMSQIIGYLLDNAINFTQEGGHIQVKTWKDKEYVYLCVSDNGVGIEPEVMSMLFTPFKQGDNSLDRSLGGLGLGLFLVKGLVELHDGTITAHSDGLGKGAKFIVCLPLREQEQQSQQQESKTRGESLQIVVIDDNKDVAQILSALLQHLGHRVEIANDGVSGLDKVRAILPDVVFCDIGLPGLNGYEVARRIRGENELKDTFLISLTGYARPEDVAQARDAGFDEHLAKPVDIEVLKSTLIRVAEILKA